MCSRHDRGRRGGAGWDGSVGMIPNRPESIRKLMKPGIARNYACARRVPPGIPLNTALGVRCEVVAPTSGEGRRSREDRSARRPEAGTELPRWRLDARVGPRRRARGATGRGARPRGGEERSAARAPSVGQVSAATRSVPAPRHDPLDPAASSVGRGCGLPTRRKRRRSWTISMRSMWPNGAARGRRTRR